ncbi:MAG: TetR/AcrR family transcriptional regulator [Candidatus Onthomonas sp.]
MKNKIDFRVQRTYKMLTTALFEAMKEKSFDEITVGELCDRAMIRRATFYKHFGDKYELYAFSIRGLQAKFEEENRLEYDQKRPQTFYVVMIDHCLQFVEQHSDVFASMMKSSSSQMLLDILSEEIQRDILLHLKTDESNGAVLPAKPGLLAAVITGALVYTMKWWIIHDAKMPREELVAVCTSLVKIV